MTAARLRLDLVPGTLCDERLWARLAPLLDSFDLHHVPLHKARTREQMRELIATHSAPKTNLVGFSLGAYLAVEYAVAHPERIETLVLIANSCKGLLPAEVEARKRIVGMLEKNAYSGMTRHRLRELLAPAHMEETTITGLIQDMAVDLGKEVLLAQFTTTIDRVDYMDRLHELPFPVLIVGAKGDQLVPAADLRDMAARLPDAQLQMITADTGHMIPLEAPGALADLLRSFYHQPVVQ